MKPELRRIWNQKTDWYNTISHAGKTQSTEEQYHECLHNVQSEIEKNIAIDSVKGSCEVYKNKYHIILKLLDVIDNPTWHRFCATQGVKLRLKILKDIIII